MSLEVYPNIWNKSLKPYPGLMLKEEPVVKHSAKMINLFMLKLGVISLFIFMMIVTKHNSTIYFTVKKA